MQELKVFRLINKDIILAQFVRLTPERDFVVTNPRTIEKVQNCGESLSCALDGYVDKDVTINRHHVLMHGPACARIVKLFHAVVYRTDL